MFQFSFPMFHRCSPSSGTTVRHHRNPQSELHLVILTENYSLGPFFLLILMNPEISQYMFNCTVRNIFGAS